MLYDDVVHISFVPHKAHKTDEDYMKSYGWVIVVFISTKGTQDCTTNAMETMRYTMSCVNVFFTILYSHGIFIPVNDAYTAQRAAMRVCVPRHITYSMYCVFFPTDTPNLMII